MNEGTTYLKELREATRLARMQLRASCPSSDQTQEAAALLVCAENVLGTTKATTLKGLEKILHMLADSAKGLADLVADANDRDFGNSPGHRVVRLLIETYLGAIPIIMVCHEGHHARKINCLGWDIEYMLSKAGMEARVSGDPDLVDAISSAVDADHSFKRPARFDTNAA